jgi:hypothetical protein
MTNELWNRIQREIKANARKSAVLVVLLLVGCCIWVPMITRAVGCRRSTVAATAKRTAQPQTPLMPATPVEPAAADPDAKPGEFWEKLATALGDDPMYRTAEVQSLSRNPFQMVEVPQPLPVLFAAEPVPKAPVNSDEDAKGLELRSTIIGRTRRAALINGQLYQLGRKIQTDGGQYQLTRIESNRVVLSSGEQTIELTLTRPQLKDIRNRNESSGPPMQ